MLSVSAPSSLPVYALSTDTPVSSTSSSLANSTQNEVLSKMEGLSLTTRIRLCAPRIGESLSDLKSCVCSVCDLGQKCLSLLSPNDQKSAVETNDLYLNDPYFSDDNNCYLFDEDPSELFFNFFVKTTKIYEFTRRILRHIILNKLSVEDQLKLIPKTNEPIASERIDEDQDIPFSVSRKLIAICKNIIGTSSSANKKSQFTTNLQQSSQVKTIDASSSSSCKETKCRVAIVADKEIFKKHCTSLPQDLENNNLHQESPERVENIEKALRDAGLMSANNTLKPRMATDEELGLCHSSKYVKVMGKRTKELLKQNTALGRDKNHAVDYAKKYNRPADSNVRGDFNYSQDSDETARFAVGAVLTAVDHVLDPSNLTSRAFCIVRPPGHHAHEESGSGFCIFNNVAIAATYLAKMGLKVAIVDWDVHHGEGTQEMVENNKNIFYFSVHRDTTRFYPGAPYGEHDQEGAFQNVLNRPVNYVAGTDTNIMREEVLGSFKEFEVAMDFFEPDFILISCGLDSHRDDPCTKKGLGLHDIDYQTMTDICVNIANKYCKGRIVSALEGGYSLEPMNKSVVAHVEALQNNGLIRV